jgi:hypothetical protein
LEVHLKGEETWFGRNQQRQQLEVRGLSIFFRENGEEFTASTWGVFLFIMDLFMQIYF